MVYDMQSISVLKGPQGTLFGANSTGGAIVFRPNTPTDTFEGYVDVGIGNYEPPVLPGHGQSADQRHRAVAPRRRMGGSQSKGFLKNEHAPTPVNGTTPRWAPTSTSRRA
jgi:outer membrane receptor protein involved in Fe transport